MSTSEDADGADAAAGDPLAAALEPLLLRLEPRTAALVRLRLGLGGGGGGGGKASDGGGLSSAAAAARIGVSRQRADQLFASALSTLRAALDDAAGASGELRALLERAGAAR
jgi:DNA-directed RNA polymerase sigma subunit (sigma70/sigma32)